MTPPAFSLGLKFVSHSTIPPRPKKPRADFPLFPHRNGRWAKKVRQRFCYFGKWADDPKGAAALQLWLDQKDELLAGRVPRALRDGVTIRDLCNRYCTTMEQRRDAGVITHRSFLDCHSTAKLVVESLGKMRLIDDLTADDFDALYVSFVKKKYNLNTLANLVQRVRVLFKYAYDNGLIDKALRFGSTFKKPKKSKLRQLRDELAFKYGDRAFEATELRTLIDSADQPLKAMILLGINCGFGNHDCGKLPQRALDLKAGWVRFPRPKTGNRRRCPLWPETVAAIREAIDQRPIPKDPENADLVFITKYGHAWAKQTQDGPVSKEATKLLKKLKLHRPGVGFYSLRRSFATIAGESRDQVAVDFIMGHVDESMAERYREHISDERLHDVVNHVHSWLFPKKKAK
jgi:integrase